jgi:hypothetical protein
MANNHVTRAAIKRLVFSYLVLSGILAHAFLLIIYLHFASTGATLHRYVSKGVEYLDRDSSPTRHVAHFARTLLLDTGIAADPTDRFPPVIEIDLPEWRGLGASKFRKDTGPRYANDGSPLAMNSPQWPIADAYALDVVRVSTVDSLKRALSEARPGTEIRLAAGKYLLDSSIGLSTNGSRERPLVLRGESVDSTVIEFADAAKMRVDGSFWTVSDMILRGSCDAEPCSTAIQTSRFADSVTVRNVFATGFTHLVRPIGEQQARLPEGLIDGVTIIGGNTQSPDHSMTEVAVRELDSEPDVILCPEADHTTGCTTDHLTTAVRKAPEGGIVLIRTGTYRQAAVLNRDRIHLIAEPGARLFETSTGGKGALVVRRDARIEGLECSHIKVSDGNGCCVRQDSGNVELVGVHFHHSQMGMLTGHKGGEITVTDSYFHDSGYDESGQLGHNIYVNSGTFRFVRSWSLAARNAGHEIKSRADRTTIYGSLIASLNARDSRLIDLPNGGYASIKGSVLGEGPRSENWELIGYGLEATHDLPDSVRHTLNVEGNTVYMDRPAGAKFVNAERGGRVAIYDNVLIGSDDAPKGNTRFKSRAAAGVGDYPDMPRLTF